MARWSYETRIWSPEKVHACIFMVVISHGHMNEIFLMIFCPISIKYFSLIPHYIIESNRLSFLFDR